MATKSINTRIKNRVDTLSAWLGEGVELLSGEIAVVRVPTGDSYVNPVTGVEEPVTELLMKVGDGSNSFDQLPWLSAKASDVYNWAKLDDPGKVSVKYNDGTSSSPSWKTYTLTDFITYVVSVIKSTTADISSINTALSGKASSSHTHGNINNAGTITSTAVTSATGVLVYDSSNKIQRATAASARSIIGAAASGHNHNTNYVKHDAAQSLTDTAKTQARTNIGAASAADLSKLTADLGELTTSVARGVNFRGEVTSAPSGATYTLKGESTPTDAIVGDMLICGEKEYIYTAASTWKELGDLGRVTTLENAHKGVTAGTYTKVTVGANGHVTSGSNPDTLAGYGISDAYTKSDVYTKAETNSLLAGKSDSGHSHTITAGVSNATGAEVTLTGTNGTNGVTYSATHKNSGVTAGTYKSVTVDAKGHVTAGTNPTTLAGYGITDAYTKDEVYKKADVYTQAQTNSKLAEKAGSSHTHGSITNDGKLGTASRVVITDGNKKIGVSSITTTKLGYLTDVTSNIQAQLNAKGTSNLTIGTTATTAAAGNHSHAAHEARTSAIEGDYVRYDSSDNKLYIGTDGELEIIFDCGGAAGHTAAAASYSMRMTTPAVSSGSDGVLEVPNGNAGDLTGVEINGETVDPSNYTVQ